MARSKCPICNGHSFELSSDFAPSGGRYKYYFIQCSSCGAVVNSVDYFNTSARIQEIEDNYKDEMKKMTAKLNQMQSYLEYIANTLRK